MKRITTYVQTHGPFLLGALVVLLFGLNFLGADLSYLPGDLGDGRFNNYLLEHAFRYFTGEQKTLWEAPFMYPENQTLSYSDNLLGTAPFYALFRILSFTRETSFQLWFLLLMLANFACAFGFLKWLLKSSRSAVLGALIFALSIGLVSQLGHAQTFPRFPMPLTLWALMLFAESLKPKHFLLASLGLVYQFYCAIYLGFFLAIPFAVILLFVFIRRFKSLMALFTNWRWTVQILLSGLASVCLLAVLMLPYYERAQLLEPKTYESVFMSLPTLKSYLFAVHGSLFWNWIDAIAVDYPAFWDHQIFPGGVAVLGGLFLVVALFWKKAKPNSSRFLPLVLAGLFTFVLFLRIDANSLYAWLFQLPGFSAMRSLSRIINLNVLFAAVGGALVAQLLLKRFSKRKNLVFLSLLALLVLDNFVPGKHTLRISKSAAQERVSALKSRMNEVPADGIVSYEPLGFDGHQNDLQLDAMLACQSLGLRCINGYSAVAPYGFDGYWDKPCAATREKWLSIKNKSIETLYVIR